MMRTALIILAITSLGALAVTGQRPGAQRRARERGSADRGSADRGSATEAAIRRVLDDQVAAWNRGDIDGFMEGYARSADTTFVSGDTITRGWQTVLDRYRRSYNTREKMGTLQFSELEITPLAPDTARALGRFTLTRPAEDKPFASGRFTLLFRRAPQGWRIIHDHTSAAG